MSGLPLDHPAYGIEPFHANAVHGRVPAIGHRLRVGQKKTVGNTHPGPLSPRKGGCCSATGWDGDSKFAAPDQSIRFERAGNHPFDAP